MAKKLYINNFQTLRNDSNERANEREVERATFQLNFAINLSRYLNNILVSLSSPKPLSMVTITNSYNNHVSDNSALETTSRNSLKPHLPGYKLRSKSLVFFIKTNIFSVLRRQFGNKSFFKLFRSQEASFNGKAF